MISLVVFDMAGTVVNEENIVYKTLQKCINDAGFSFTLEQVLEFGAGKEKFQAIKDVMASENPSFLEETAANIFESFKITLKKAYQDLDVAQMPGTSSVFHQLKAKGVKIALNTGYDRKTAEGLIEKIGWQKGSDYDELVTASDVSRGRPNPDMIHLAMAKTGIENASEVVKIGDSAIDIEEGKNAGCRLTFGITTGAQTRAQLLAACPDYVVESIEEMAQVILQN